MGLKIRDNSNEIILNPNLTQQQQQQQQPFQHLLQQPIHQQTTQYYNSNQLQLNQNCNTRESRKNCRYQQSEKFPQLQNHRLESLHHNYHLHQQHILPHQYYDEAAVSRSNTLPVTYSSNTDKYIDINMSTNNSLPILEEELLSSLLEPPFNDVINTNSTALTCQQQDQQPNQQIQARKHQQQLQEAFLKGSYMLRQAPSVSFSTREFSTNSFPPSVAKRDLRVSRDETTERSGLVTQFPHKEKLEGYNFKVKFPSDSPKLVVSTEGELKRIHSVNDSLIAIFFNHSAGPKAKIRFLVVFSNEGESTTPVHPCRNHQKSNHPAHILEICGIAEASWETHPHPSILVIPCKTNGSLVNLKNTMTDADFSDTEQYPIYCAQMKFLCRNSCLTRKDLTLICQLEVGSEVLARESFLLKVSACPRRDAKSKRSLSEDGMRGSDILKKRKRNCDSESKIMDLVFPKQENEDEDNSNKVSNNNGSLVAMVTETRRSVFLMSMTSSFQALHPDEFAREKEKFNHDWNNFITNQNDEHQ